MQSESCASSCEFVESRSEFRSVIRFGIIEKLKREALHLLLGVHNVDSGADNSQGERHGDQAASLEMTVHFVFPDRKKNGSSKAAVWHLG